MKKLTQQQLIDLVSGLGLAGVEVVENEADSDFDQNAALSLIDSNRRKILEPTLRNDIEAELKPAIEGRVLGGIRAMLARNTGLSHSKLKEFPEDKMEDMIKAAIGHKVGQIEGNTEETTKKFEELVKAHNDALEAKETEWTKKHAELNEKYVSRDMLDVLRGHLKEAPLPEGLDRDIAAKDLMSHLREKYHLSYDEAAKQVALMDKSNPAIPALNEAKNAQIDILSEAKGYFEPRSLWVKDMRGKNPAEAMAGKGQNPNLPQPVFKQGVTSAEQARQARIEGYEKAGGL
jgi:hypothetical protein